MDDDVPLVVPEVNADLHSIPRACRQPQLHHDGRHAGHEAAADEAGLEAMIISTYQAVSGAACVRELDEQAQKVAPMVRATYDGRAVSIDDGPNFVKPIALNVLPFAGALVDDGLDETNEEQKLRFETARSWVCPTSRSRAPVCASRFTPVTLCHQRPVLLSDHPRRAAASSPMPMVSC